VKCWPPTELLKIDLFSDLNTEDETGLPWSYLDQATDPSVVVPGGLTVVGSGSAVATAQVIDDSTDGLVYVRPVTERSSKSANPRQGFGE
jgi:hypothetical protein